MYTQQLYLIENRIRVNAEGIFATWAMPGMDETSVFSDAEGPESPGQLAVPWLTFQEEILPWPSRCLSTARF